MIGLKQKKLTKEQIFLKNYDFSKRNAEKRKYYLANEKPLIDYIISKFKEKNINLNEDEELELESILYVESFFGVIYSVLENYNLNEDHDFFQIVLDNIIFFNALLIQRIIYKEGKNKLKNPFNRTIYKLSQLNPSFSKVVEDYSYLLDRFKEI